MGRGKGKGEEGREKGKREVKNGNREEEKWKREGKIARGKGKGEKRKGKGASGKRKYHKKKVIKCFKKSGGTLKLTFLGLYYTTKIQKFSSSKFARASETCQIHLFLSHGLGEKI